MPADIVIRGGSLVDGTGAPARSADIALTDGVVSDIGDGLDGRRVLEAGGNVVAPGFIDIHTHYDAQVFWDPALTPSCWHGVTSVVAGNCGFSIAPVRPEHRELLVRTLQHVEDMAPDTLFEGVPWTDFETFPQYFDAIERRGTLLNYACYVGHTAVRIFVMGEAGYEKEATDDDVRGMQRVIAEALDAGAAGFATSASPTHNGDRGRPVPSRIADLEEVCALVQPLHDAHKGVVALLPGEKVTHADVFDVQRAAGRPLTWTALLTVKGFPWHEKIMAANTQARAEGVEVWPQVSCRPLTFQMNLREPFTFNMRPAFQELMDRPLAERTAAYRDPAWRTRAWDELEGRGGKRALPMNFDSLLVAESVAHPGAHRSQRGRRRRGASLHTLRPHARPVTRGEPRDPLHERARQQRSRRDRVAAPAGHRLARPGRLRRPRESALRRVLRDRPARHRVRGAEFRSRCQVTDVIATA